MRGGVKDSSDSAVQLRPAGRRAPAECAACGKGRGRHSRHVLLQSSAPRVMDMRLSGQAKGDSERDRDDTLDASPLHVREWDQRAAAAVSSCCRLVKLT